MKLLGVYREPEFSPGRVDADAAILDLALDHLVEVGAEVVRCPPAQMPEHRGDFELVLAMCQSQPALRRLAQYEAEGALVVNSPRAIRNCYRDRMGELLRAARVPVPFGVLVETAAQMKAGLPAGFAANQAIYIKRGDFHALEANDVVRVQIHDEIWPVLAEMAARGIASAYLQQAVSGQVVKFYGVSGDPGYFAALPEHASLPPDFELKIRRAAIAAAAALGLEIWGGDAIVSSGDFWLIDFNDWPSFSRVREQAAAAMARRAIALSPGLTLLIARDHRENRFANGMVLKFLETALNGETRHKKS